MHGGPSARAEDHVRPSAASAEAYDAPVLDLYASARRIAYRAVAKLESEHTCWTILGIAMVLSVALYLRLTRGFVFHEDDYLYFVGNRGFDFRVLIGPHNGHLILVPRMIYALSIALFGADYRPIRVVGALAIVLAAGLFFALTKRKVGAAVALAPSVLLLFFGTAWQNTIDPDGMTHVIAVAAGLGALLALETPSLRADLTGCALLIVSVATFSVGLAFVVGVAVSVLLRADRGRRWWIFVVPLAVYGAWFIAPKLHTTPFSTSTGLSGSNVLLIPNYIADAGAAAIAAITGLSYDFTIPASTTIDSPWGYVLGAVAFTALVFRLRRGNVPPSLWISLATLLAYWTSTALVYAPTREPIQNRYIYDGAVMVLLVASDALRGIRFSRTAILALFTATVLSLGTNIATLRVAGASYRSDAPIDRAMLAAVDIARDHVAPNFVPSGELFLGFSYLLSGRTGNYLAAVRHNGSFAFTLPELRSQSESLRETADQNLASALQLHLAPVPKAGRVSKCLRGGSPGGAPVDLPLRPPGLVLESSQTQVVKLRRFAALPTASVGTLAAGTFYALRIPVDRAPDPWHSMLSGAVTVCTLGPRP
jgi:hypothetical protein